MRRAPVAAVLALILLPALVRAQGDGGPEVQLSVDRPRPAADDIVRVTFTFTGPGAGGSLRAPGALPLKNLRVVAGPNSSTQISFINGEIKRSSSLTYFVKAQGPGPAEVGETTWRIADRDVKVAAYALDVGPPRRPGEAPGPGAGPGVGAEEEDPFERFFGRRVAPNRADYERPMPREEPFLAVVATPDRTSAYVGEEVVVHYELITQADIQGIEWVEVPKFPGCWAEDIERPDRPTPRRDTVDGRPVVRFTLLKKAVSGLSAGTVELPSAKVKLLARGGGDPFFDPFGGMRPQVVERTTKPVTLKILPIPGHPSWKGPVGQFDLTASLDRTNVPAGDAATLKVKLAGTGNLRTVTEAPALEVPGARVYPPTTRGGGPRAAAGRGPVTMEWDYVVVPAQAGTVTIPPVQLAVFDPSSRRVVVKASQPISLAVKGTPLTAPAATPEAVAATTGGAALTVPAAPAPPERPAPSSPKGPAPEPTVDLARQTVAVPLWAVLAIPLAVLAGAGGTALALRRRKARRALLSGLGAQSGETKERAADRIERALREPLGRRLGVPDGAPLSALLDALERSDLPRDLGDEIRGLLADVDFLRFAPQLGDYAAEIERARERAAAVLPRIR